MDIAVKAQAMNAITLKIKKFVAIRIIINFKQKNMKQMSFILSFINLLILAQTTLAQSYPKIEDVDVQIKSEFYSDWSYFRMWKNPLIPDSIKYNVREIVIPSEVIFPQELRGKGYLPDIKISVWGKAKGYSPTKTGQNQYIDLSNTGFYLIEKKDGYDMVKRDWRTDSLIDAVHLNIYDSIFHYDNRFLIRYLYTDKKSFNEHFSFLSGNAEWGEWKDAGLMRDVDMVGFVRGAQFGIENVLYFRQDFSDKIKQFRPGFPNYIYTANRYPSLLSTRYVIIGAPAGKEDQLVEYIYYTNKPEKTGDANKTHYYEMRYILPTNIESIKERHLEKRRLTEAEQKYILDSNNGMLYYIEWKPEPIDEEVIEIK